MQIAESATLNAGQWWPEIGEVQEVDDVAEAHPVEQVADGAAEDQRQADLQAHALVRGAQGVGRDDQEDDHGDAVQQDGLQRGVHRGEQAEGRARCCGRR